MRAYRQGWVVVFVLASLMLPGTGALARESGPIVHAVFIAGPNFTGIIDEQGQAVWETKKGARDGYVLDNGHVLVAWAKEVVEFDKDHKPVWTYRLDPSNGEIGSACRLADGNTLIAELGKNPRLIEVSKDGEVKVEVKLDPETDNTHMQTRMARKLENGNYLVPHLLAFAVKEYTPKGKVVRELKTDTEHFGGREAKNWPFTAIRSPGSPAHPKGTTVVGCTYGNRVAEFDDEGRVVWELTNNDVGGIIKDACGVQRLPNGNTVVACYGKKDGVKLFEVTAEKKIVWQYEGPYRVHHFQVLTTAGKALEGPAMK